MYIGLDLVDVKLTEKSFYEFLKSNSRVLTKADSQDLEKLAQDMEYLAEQLKRNFKIRERVTANVGKTNSRKDKDGNARKE